MYVLADRKRTLRTLSKSYAVSGVGVAVLIMRSIENHLYMHAGGFHTYTEHLSLVSTYVPRPRVHVRTSPDERASDSMYVYVLADRIRWAGRADSISPFSWRLCRQGCQSIVKHSTYIVHHTIEAFLSIQKCTININMPNKYHLYVCRIFDKV
jgi:hypothetical protein